MHTLADKSRVILDQFRVACCEAVEQDVVLWLFRFDENANAFAHWDMLPPKPDASSILQSLVIPAGSGTLGYVGQIQKPVCINDTFDDPRGTVAILDSIVGNYAWCGIPVFEDVPDTSGTSKSTKKVIAVVSFFPTGEKRWDLDPGEVAERLSFQVKDPGNEVIIQMLTYAEQQQAIARHALNEAKKPIGETTLPEDFARLLDEVRYNAYSTYSFRNILLIQQRDDNTYRLGSAANLKHDYKRTEIDAIAELQWASIQAAGRPMDTERRFFGDLATISLELGPAMLFKGYVRRVSPEVEQLLRSYFGHFETLFRCLRAPDWENCSQRKRSLDIKVQLFDFLAKLLFRACQVEPDEDLLPEPHSSRLQHLVRLITSQKDVLACIEQSEALDLLKADDLKSRLKGAQVLARESAIELVALTFWIKKPQWKICTASGLPGGTNFLKAPATWKVLQRAVEEQNPLILETYPSLYLEEATDWRVTTQEPEKRTLSAVIESKRFEVSFTYENVPYPLTLQLQWNGYERLLFERFGQGLEFATNLDAGVVQFQHSDTSRELDTVAGIELAGLRGSYAVLAKNHASLIIAGPIIPDGNVRRMPPRELESYCQKSLDVVLLSESRRQFRRVSLRSGIARIMARNMSHNIGSHALWHRGEFLRSLIKELEDFTCPLSIETLSRIRNEYVGHVKQGQQFIHYLQKRMDFIAQVSTASPSWCQATRWKDLVKGLTGQACLLDNIVLSYDLSRSRNLEVNPVPNNSDDYHVDIAHGGIGAHAFYSIVENILRNCAKYGNQKELKTIREANEQKTPVQKLILAIGIDDSWTDTCGTRWVRDYYRVSIQDNLQTFKDDLCGIRKGLSEPIIENENLGPRNWGLKEIKICAAYLRLVRLEQLDEKYEELSQPNAAVPPLVTVSLRNPEGRDVTDGPGKLTYTLYLLRPKKALLVGRKYIDLKADKYRQIGIDYLESIESLKEEIAANRFPRHSFLVIDDDGEVDWTWLADHVHCLPNRIIRVGGEASEKNPSLLPSDYLHLGELPDRSPDGLLPYLWKAWVARYYSWSRLCFRFDKTELQDERTGSQRDALPLFYLKEHANSSDQGLLVYDHADAIGGYKVDQPESKIHELYSVSAFHECLDSQHPVRAFIEQTLTAGHLAECYHIQEASAASVAVIDERIYPHRDDRRIQGIGSKRYSDNLTLGAALSKRRVYLLNPHAYEEAQDLVEYACHATDPLQASSKSGILLERYDFLVVHQGVVDKMRKICSPENFEKGWLALKKKARWVVIETGRGKPDMAVHEGLRWVEYSSLAQALMLDTKLELTDLLFSLRGEPRGQGDA